MKRYKLYQPIVRSVLILVFLSSCLEELEDPAPGKSIANIYPTEALSYFAGVTNSIVIEIEIFENQGVTISSITVSKQLFTVLGNSEVVSFEIAPNSFEQTTSQLFADVPVNDIVLTEADLAPGDHWEFSYKFSLTDGSVLIKPTGTTVTFLCPSDLAGTHTYSTVGWCGGPWTGTTTWVTESTGVYSISDGDYAFGAYHACYSPTATLPGGNLRIKDICNTLSWVGASRWGEVYWFNSVTVNGADLILDWENDYGEAGVATITREGGANCPPLRTE